MGSRVIAGQRFRLRSDFLWALSLTGVAVLAIALRFIGLERPADYDEGVYWQSLRAMSAGFVLYRDIYDSQPPLFLIAAFPLYQTLGASLFAARLAMIAASLAGLIAMFAIGRTVAGKTGGLIAVLLLSINTAYLAESQSLHAEIPATALAIAAVALSLRQGRLNAAAAGFLAGAAVLCKLLVVAAPIPFIVLALSRRRVDDFVWFAAAFIAAVTIAILPFVGDVRALMEQVFFYHTAAEGTYHASLAANYKLVGGALKTPLFFAAAAGAAAGVLRRDVYVLPLAAWFTASILTLLAITPLWEHHLVILFPPLIALAALGLKAPFRTPGTAALRDATIFLMALEIVFGGLRLKAYYTANEHLVAASSWQQFAARDLAHAVPPAGFVLSDFPGVAAVAGRSVPPWLVDLSEVRVHSKAITSSQLIAQASQWHVNAILLGSGRLTLPELSGFRTWLQAHYRVARQYAGGAELWIRQPAAPARKKNAKPIARREVAGRLAA